MGVDLETLKTEIQAYLDQEGMPVFHGYSRLLDSVIPVFWDVQRHPDFRQFVGTARRAGAKLIVFSHRPFSLDQIDEALDTLEDSDLARDEKRTFENRLRELQAYEGFTCAIELSFDMEGRVYVYEMRTEWYEAMTDIVAEIEAATGDLEDGGDQDSISGFFSKN
jgi:hypothetical protein